MRIKKALMCSARIHQRDVEASPTTSRVRPATIKGGRALRNWVSEAVNPTKTQRFGVAMKPDDTERALGVNSVVREWFTLSDIRAARCALPRVVASIGPVPCACSATAAWSDDGVEAWLLKLGIRWVTVSLCPTLDVGSGFVDQERCSPAFLPGRPAGGSGARPQAFVQANDIATKKGTAQSATFVDKAEMRKVASSCCSESRGTMSAQIKAAAKNWAAKAMPASLGASLASRDVGRGALCTLVRTTSVRLSVAQGARETRKEPS
jgi:hypothetical protein